MNRIDRLSAILIMLQSSTSVKPKQITDRFTIGLRTVYRDIKALEEAGIPIAGDSRIGYSLVDGFKLPPLMFTQEEAVSFLVAQRLVDKFGDKGVQRNYNSGIEKIKAVMRLVQKEEAINIDNKIGSLDFSSPLPNWEQDWLQIIMDAIVKNKKIELTYQAINSDTARFVDCVGVFFSMANWYLIGFCNLRNSYRTFRLSRIQEIKISNYEAATKHPPLQSFLQELTEKQNLHEITIEIKHDKFTMIDSQKYFHGLIEEQIIGDMIQLRFMTFSIDKFARWYLAFADVATIISPNELKRTVKEIVGKILLTSSMRHPTQESGFSSSNSGLIV
ncbi:MAG: YafY family transcriptional regulator [Tannerellaceae bacterium]|jgi:predicted DNA-binding transcriptional regulator YafY|nr:YafY family transcriptional regulator [Tannerellaceae bacterium]